MPSVTHRCPDGNSATEPRALFPAAVDRVHRGSVGAVHVRGVPGSNGMALAGHQGHYYPGTTTTHPP